MAGGGGVARDHQGNWKGGFFVNLGWCTTGEAEFWAAIHGLRFAWEQGIRLLVMETNSTQICTWITQNGNLGSLFRYLKAEYSELLNKEWSIVVKHAPGSKQGS